MEKLVPSTLYEATELYLLRKRLTGDRFAHVLRKPIAKAEGTDDDSQEEDDETADETGE